MACVPGVRPYAGVHGVRGLRASRRRRAWRAWLACVQTPACVACVVALPCVACVAVPVCVACMASRHWRARVLQCFKRPAGGVPPLHCEQERPAVRQPPAGDTHPRSVRGPCSDPSHQQRAPESASSDGAAAACVTCVAARRWSAWRELWRLWAGRAWCPGAGVRGVQGLRAWRAPRRRRAWRAWLACVACVQTPACVACAVALPCVACVAVPVCVASRHWRARVLQCPRRPAGGVPPLHCEQERPAVPQPPAGDTHQGSVRGPFSGPSRQQGAPEPSFSNGVVAPACVSCGCAWRRGAPPSVLSCVLLSAHLGDTASAELRFPLHGPTRHSLALGLLWAASTVIQDSRAGWTSTEKLSKCLC
uniref:uncharacterized protein LOC103790735 n=1 Tax=Callithrix jacchus TaxID=9483 RepID=UPI0023DD4231|nr:uncharacterized protein LOC103790735 [Callithrix jacchus]XP_035141914.2 uncharacterized protein LOC103790735 [Callithrix jacchus]XP_035141915.2 uncharacterized protein LOC103790735 [Callithrix jacchus]XP_054106458.1 uncharacterized protein LOC103790735 [Callithrix jacchus]XP_054106459.1 uncharacterized protein LOC103790735 [Callithrix jacchus]XP_054106460.1 uncharacterized protein LOC103790735 [Callithrix jacchus]XP_054106461.1 uncharacterized protein LOC103790735 [Callithrix jacchus]XP_0